MKIAFPHRKSATSVFVLALAGLLPGPVQGEVATAQVSPQAAPAVIQTMPVPAVAVDRAEGDAAPVKSLDQPKTLDQSAPKTLEKSTILGEGMASFYGAELAGNRTASGERFNPNALTAAHRTLPMGTKLRVTNKANGKSVIVRINDRGPFSKGRIIDVSREAAEQISMVRSGTARVTLERIG
ncbi:MAG TPA: septal ring lytic transglycosylase RlpA family protein [Allosphingosinicella sp.]|nr:septal ring lytic transglycosylase RlpA family protein [Allosphingosinicella sp.]